MGKLKHTPGPWTVVPSDTPAYVFIRSPLELGQIATVYERAEANGALIAEAPNLLECLKWAMENIGSYSRRTSSNGAFCDAVDRANATIAAAERRKGTTK